MSSLRPEPSVEPRWLGIDGGSSSLRWCAIGPGGRVVDRGADPSGGTNLHVEPAEAVLRRLIQLAEPHRHCLHGVAIGTAGIDAPEDVHHFGTVFRALAPALGLGRDAVRVHRDVEIIAATSDRPLRVCLIAGTGSSAYGLRVDPAREAWVGGLDLPLSDWGSGAWLGEVALVEALRQACGMRAPTALGPAVFERFALRWPGDWRALKPARARLTKPDLGRLATLVASLAVAGDPAARGIEAAAAEALAEMGFGVLRQLEATPEEAPDVRCVGAVLQENHHIRGRFEELVREGFPAARFGDADAALGAAHVARGEAAPVSSRP